MAHITSPRLRIAERAARQTAAKVRRELGEMARWQVKPSGPQVQAKKFRDVLAKELIEKLIENYPQDGFVVDERTLKEPEEKGCVWHINALGGLENFSRGKNQIYQLFVVMKGDEPIEALAYDPLADDIALCVKSAGAFGYGTRLRVSGRKTLEGGLVHLNAATALATDAFQADTRITGSCLDDVFAVCSGQAEALYYAPGLFTAEGAFGWLMVTESGGKATRLQKDTPFIAGNIHAFKALSKS